MSNGTTITFRDLGLQRLRTDMATAKGAFLKVGILGKYANRASGQTGLKRTDGALTNAEIGARHEFGSELHNCPQRSFLRTPLLQYLPGKLQKIGAETWQRVLEEFGFVHFLNTIGQEAIGTIEDAFRTQGFGKWQKLSSRRIREKGHDNILTDTAQLRKSITFAVVAKGAQRKPL